jgi:endonuclease/exonuclease/phosphatase family metal-dependent hydrolase
VAGASGTLPVFCIDSGDVRPAAPAPVGGPPLRLVTFNIRHGIEAGGVAVRLDLLAEVCASFDADVLALQEVDRFTSRVGGADLAAVVAEATGLEMAFANAIPDYRGGEYGNAVLVRGSLDDVEVFDLPRRRSAGPGHEQRVVLLATAQLERAPVPVSMAATHLAVQRRMNAPQLRAVVARLAERPRPRLVIGDLNRVPRELARLRVFDGYQIAGGEPTFPQRRPVMRIDHIAVDGLTILSSEVVPTKVSDHRALVVTVAPGAGGASGRV